MFKRLMLTLTVVVALFAVMVGSAAAQTDNDRPGTITVTGNGSAVGSPDVAYIELGVETRDNSISTAFGAANNTIDNIINALAELGVAREDIRTISLNIYRDHGGMMPMMGTGTNDDGTVYVVNNQVRVVVRDIDAIAEVINTAVESGANQLYGLSFGISDTAALESEARADAIADARARAGELADLTGITLGAVVSVVEYSNGPGFYPVMDQGFGARGGGGGGAVIEPGTLNVNLSVEITFAIGG